MTDKEDYWQEEDFEDTVAAALIACFESKIRKQRSLPAECRLTKEHLMLARKHGPYIPSNSRVVIPASSEKLMFDVENDSLPDFGVLSNKNPNTNSKDTKQYGGYFITHMFRKIDRLPRHWARAGGGTLYEMTVISAEDDGVSGEKNYFSVGRDGEMFVCTWNNPNYLRTTEGIEQHWTMQLWHGLSGLILLADRRFCWTITAQENVARAHLGCMQEEVKSLLYARSLPMTATGRKRPILHLIEAHKRRMRNGTDIDVTAFLRGTQSVEIGGTEFKVNPPRTLQPKVSLNSQLRYYGSAA